MPSAFTTCVPRHVEGRGHPSVYFLRQSLCFVAKDFILSYVYVCGFAHSSVVPFESQREHLIPPRSGITGSGESPNMGDGY